MNGMYAALDAPIRQAIPQGALCRTCVHVMELCREYRKESVPTEDGRRRIVKCNGYTRQAIDAAALAAASQIEAAGEASKQLKQLKQLLSGIAS